MKDDGITYDNLRLFDSCLMFMVMVTFLVIRPGDVMSQKHDEEFVDLDGLDSDESKVVSNPQ